MLRLIAILTLIMPVHFVDVSQATNLPDFSSIPSSYKITKKDETNRALYFLSIFDDGSVTIRDLEFKDEDGVPVGRSCRGGSEIQQNVLRIESQCSDGFSLSLDIDIEGLDINSQEFHTTLHANYGDRVQTTFLREGQWKSNAAELNKLSIKDFSGVLIMDWDQVGTQYRIQIDESGKIELRLLKSENKWATPDDRCVGYAHLQSGFITADIVCENYKSKTRNFLKWDLQLKGFDYAAKDIKLPLIGSGFSSRDLTKIVESLMWVKIRPAERR